MRVRNQPYPLPEIANRLRHVGRRATEEALRLALGTPLGDRGVGVAAEAVATTSCGLGLFFELEALVLVGSPQTQSLYPILYEFGRGALSGSDLDGGPAFTHGLT